MARTGLMLFPDSLITEIRQLPGASHSFLRQLCQDGADPAREQLKKAVEGLALPLRVRMIELLHSLDNRRFFQGYAELSTAALLTSAGWMPQSVERGSIRALRNDGSVVNILVLAFLSSGRLGVEEEAVQRLRESLERVQARLRFSIFVRKWLPHDFNPEPVRQAVEMWLQEVEGGKWDGRFAAYEDESVSLEFGLTGERAKAGQALVVQALGPFMAARTVAVLESVLVREMDRYRLGSERDVPLVISLVGDQPWLVSRGYVRELLYGKPRWTVGSTHPGSLPWEGAVGLYPEPCLFKDPLYRALSGIMMIERPVGDALGLDGRVYSNPFAISPITPGELPFRVLAEHRREDGEPVIRWFQPEERSIHL